MAVLNKTFAPPALPLAGVEYRQRYLDDLIRILRLYFNANDSLTNDIVRLLNNGGLFPSLNADVVNADQFNGGNFNGLDAIFSRLSAAVLSGNIQGGDGVFNNLTGSQVNASLFTGAGQQINFPHIAASDSTDQYADGDDDPTIVVWDTLAESRGFTLNVNNTATAQYDGVYKIDYSLQFANTDNAAHDVFVWLEVNGSAVPDSSSRFTLPARKNDGVFSYLVAYSHITFEIEAGQSVGLWWATNKAYNPVGPVNGVYMEHIDAQTTPYVRPANPSAVGSIVYVSAPVPALAKVTPIGVISTGQVGEVELSVRNNT